MHPIFFELFEALPRQGPGSSACTQRAFELCAELPVDARVLDLGCGAGAQTLDLARLGEGKIVAVDMHPPLVALLRAKAEHASLSERIDAQVADMNALEWDPAGFDLVWSEGALYNLGLERALEVCAEQLRPGGYLAFTEAVWRSDDPPQEVREAFADYPTMGRAPDVLRRLEARGWTLIGHFDVPTEAWWEDFYSPMEARLDVLRRKYADQPDALPVLEELAKEPDMHRRCNEHYGYTFFVARRPAAST